MINPVSQAVSLVYIPKAAQHVLQYTKLKAKMKQCSVDTEGRNHSGYNGHRRHTGLREIRGQKGSEDRNGSAQTVFTGHKRCSEQRRISGHRKVRRLSRHRRLGGNNVQ